MNKNGLNINEKDYIQCPLCEDHKEFHKSGIQTHFKHIHNKSWIEYKQSLISNVCKVCGKKLKREDQTFCSRKCSSIHAIEVKKELKTNKKKFKYYKTPEMQYNLIFKEKKEEIIKFYLENEVSKKDVIEKFNLDYGCLNKIFKEKNIKTREKMNVKTINFKSDQKEKELLNSKIAKQIVFEYSNNIESIRSLSKKYHDQYKISRDDIRKILVFYKVQLKDPIELKNQITEKNIKNGKRHPNFGKNQNNEKLCRPDVKWYFYKGINYQGTFEFKFCLWLENKNIKFDCHKNIKPIKYIKDNVELNYYPDFYLNDFKTFIEIKGFFYENDKVKMELVKKCNPNLKIRIFNEKKLIKMGILDIDKKINIKIEDYIYSHDKKDFFLEIEKQKISKEKLINLFLYEGKSLKQISKEENIKQIFLERIREIYGIPKRFSKEYYELRLNFFIQKFGEEIKKYYLEFNTVEQISKKYNISLKTVYEVLKKLNVKRDLEEVKNIRFNKAKNIFLENNKEKLQKAIELYLKGNSFSYVSRQFKISRKMFVDYLRRNKLLRDDQKNKNIENLRRKNIFKEKRKIKVESNLIPYKKEILDFLNQKKSKKFLCKKFKVTIMCFEMFLEFLEKGII